MILVYDLGGLFMPIFWVSEKRFLIVQLGKKICKHCCFIYMVPSYQGIYVLEVILEHFLKICSIQHNRIKKSVKTHVSHVSLVSRVLDLVSLRNGWFKSPHWANFFFFFTNFSASFQNNSKVRCFENHLP